MYIYRVYILHFTAVQAHTQASSAHTADKTRNMLALAIHGDEAKLDRAHRLLQAMMNPDPYARAVPAELLNNVRALYVSEL